MEKIETNNTIIVLLLTGNGHVRLEVPNLRLSSYYCDTNESIAGSLILIRANCLALSH